MKDVVYAVLLVLMTMLILGWVKHEEYKARYQAPPVVMAGGER